MVDRITAANPDKFLRSYYWKVRSDRGVPGSMGSLSIDRAVPRDWAVDLEQLCPRFHKRVEPAAVKSHATQVHYAKRNLQAAK